MLIFFYSKGLSSVQHGLRTVKLHLFVIVFSGSFELPIVPFLFVDTLKRESRGWWYCRWRHVLRTWPHQSTAWLARTESVWKPLRWGESVVCSPRGAWIQGESAMIAGLSAPDSANRAITAFAFPNRPFFSSFSSVLCYGCINLAFYF